MQFAKKLEAEGLARFESYSHKIGGGASLRLLLRKPQSTLAVLGSDSGAAPHLFVSPLFRETLRRHFRTRLGCLWCAAT